MNDLFGRPIYYIDQLYSVNEYDEDYTHHLAAAWFAVEERMPAVTLEIVGDTLLGAFYGEVYDPDIIYYTKVARILENLLVIYLYIILFIVMHLA